MVDRQPGAARPNKRQRFKGGKGPGPLRVQRPSQSAQFGLSGWIWVCGDTWCFSEMCVNVEGMFYILVITQSCTTSGDVGLVVIHLIPMLRNNLKQ